MIPFCSNSFIFLSLKKIQGTKVYKADQGGFAELGMLDVMQIFGRAGRPQFDKKGKAAIVTEHETLPLYLNLLTHQLPIESKFLTTLTDNLNAEVVLGTVSTVPEAVTWLSYTYLHVRAQKNPLKYGVNHLDLVQDPSLINLRRKWITVCFFCFVLFCFPPSLFSFPLTGRG